MTTTNNTNATQTTSNFRFVIAFALLLLASTGVFGQTTNTTAAVSTTTEVTVSTETAVASTSMDFALWFMGNKQATPSNENTVTGKKSFITAGMSSNKVMIKTFLKRVINQESNVA